MTLFLPGFLRLWRRREPLLCAAAQGGALLVVVGWALRGSWASAAVNAAWLDGSGVAYAREGRARVRTDGAGTAPAS